MTSIGHIIEVRVIRVAVDEVHRVHVIDLDAVVRVVVSFHDRHTQRHHIVYAATEGIVSEVVPG